MATIDQINANRENSTHSTGPTTESGKATCSQNSLKHGLASSRIIIYGESQEEYDEALDRLIAEHQPQTPTEILFIEDLAKHRWLAQRAIELQNRELLNGLRMNNEIPKSLGVLIRYQTTNERAAHKDLAAFVALRKARLAQSASEIGSAPQTAAAPTPAQAPSIEIILEMAKNGYFYNPVTGKYDEPELAQTA